MMEEHIEAALTEAGHRMEQLQGDVTTLFNRNRRLERLLREARNCRALCSPVPSHHVYRVEFEAFFDLLDALSALDKED